MTAFILTYLGANLLRTYILFRFYSIFFDRSTVNKKVEILSYLVFFLVNSSVYLIFDNMNLNLACNLIMCFIVILNYKSSLFPKLLYICFFYVLGFFSEGLIIFTLRVFSIDYSENLTILYAISVFFYYLIVLTVGNIYKINKNYKIEFSNWIATVTIPVGSIFICICLTTEDLAKDYIVQAIAINFLFFANIAIFYLYNSLNLLYTIRIEKNMAEQQRKYYANQLDILTNSYGKTEKIRHDMKNHFLSLDTLIEEGEIEKTTEYVKNFLEEIKNPEELVASGNLVIDSILNYKLCMAKKQGIDITTDIKIPKGIQIPDYDISIIFGNLLDNAIEAANKCSEEKKITIEVKMEKGVLHIYIDNAFDGIVKYKNQNMATRKSEKGHGFGITNVKETVDRYEGFLEIEHTEKLFSVSILIPIDPKNDKKA